MIYALGIPLRRKVRIRRQESAAVSRTNLESSKAVQGSFENQTWRRYRRFILSEAKNPYRFNTRV